MPKTAFLFPGQGAQSVGMGAQLAKELPAAKALFETAAEILGYDLLDICTNGPEEKLNSTVHSQPALFVCSMAALEQLKYSSPELIEGCEVSAGLSLGEYTALVFAGALDFESGLRLVQTRGEAMQSASDAVPSSMVSILGMQREQIEQLCDDARGEEILQVANLLCPGNIVVSGHTVACERIAKLAEEAGAMKVIPLAVAGAFHTPLMKPAAELLGQAVGKVEFKEARIPVVCNVDAKPHRNPADFSELLMQQLTNPVLWHDSMQRLIDDGVEQCYEIGTGRVLRGLLKRINRKLPCENVSA